MVENKENEEEKIFPDLEEFVSGAPNPKELREEVGEALREGIEEARDLRERIGRLFESRTTPLEFSKDYGVDLVEKSLEDFSQTMLKSVSLLRDRLLGKEDENS